MRLMQVTIFEVEYYISLANTTKNRVIAPTAEKAISIIREWKGENVEIYRVEKDGTVLAPVKEEGEL